MARIKYNPLLYPVQGKHYGFTFIRNHYGFSMLPAQRNKRTRWNRQAQRMQNIQKAIRNWRNMDAATQANWDTFAASHPVPSKRSASVFLTGYQLFLKRNHYCFLNHGIESDFMMEPELTALPAGGPVFYLQAGINQVDVTALYISNFGTIPAVGQWVQFMAIPYSETSGQFFPAIHSTLEILATYIDGFFLSIEMPVNVAGIVYSVYLSKPLHRGYEYPGSKVRYMGCFTSKSFLGLSDTPNSFAGQAGKMPVVKVDETGLEWGAGGGGGLTCADLPACPTIIDIYTQIANLGLFFFKLGVASYPAIKFGMLYNAKVLSDERFVWPVGWRLPTDVEISAMVTTLGGAAIAGGKMKEFDSYFWLTQNITAVPTSPFHGRGSGFRLGAGGFQAIQQQMLFWSSTPFNATNQWYGLLNFSNDDYTRNAALNDHGMSIRLVKTDAVVAPMVGNNGIQYRTAKIGNLVWCLDNLCETHFRNGDVIPIVPLNADWTGAATPKACYYNNDITNGLF